MRKPAFAYAETKAQISCAADQGLCFRYTDNTIPLLPLSEILSPKPYSGGTGGFVSEMPKRGFLTMRLT